MGTLFGIVVKCGLSEKREVGKNVIYRFDYTGRHLQAEAAAHLVVEAQLWDLPLQALVFPPLKNFKNLPLWPLHSMNLRCRLSYV